MKFASPVLFVQNVQSVVDFYESAFGFERKFFDPDLGFAEMTLEGASLGIASHKSGELMMPGAYPTPASGGPSGIELAFYTEDVNSCFERAVNAGAERLAAPYTAAWGQQVAYVRSIEGTVIGFCAPLETEDASG